MSEALCPWPSQRDHRAVASSPRSPRCRTELWTHGPGGRGADRRRGQDSLSGPLRLSKRGRVSTSEVPALQWDSRKCPQTQ